MIQLALSSFVYSVSLHEVSGVSFCVSRGCFSKYLLLVSAVCVMHSALERPSEHCVCVCVCVCVCFVFHRNGRTTLFVYNVHCSTLCVLYIP